MAVKSNLSKSWLSNEIQKSDRTERAISQVILYRSRMLAPVMTGELRENGRVEKKDGHYTVTFGDSKVPYARRRHFENKKNPQTLHYLKRAGDSVKKENIKKYYEMSA